MRPVSIVHWADGKTFPELNSNSKRSVQSIVPLGIVQTRVQRCAQKRQILAGGNKVRLLPRRRANPVRACSEEERRAIFLLGDYEQGKEWTDLFSFRVRLDPDLNPMVEAVIQRKSPSRTIQLCIDKASREYPFRMNPTPTEGCAFAWSPHSCRRYGKFGTFDPRRVGFGLLRNT